MRYENHDILVEWEDIGEGLSGEYNPDDPKDVALLRFYISKWDDDNGGFHEVDDASYCTNVPVDTDEDELLRLLKLIYETVAPSLRRGESIKKLGEALSWLGPNENLSDLPEHVQPELQRNTNTNRGTSA